ncbi:MAG: hypothetical protein QF440_06965 [Candidatus Thalassarchaeaceae archaeon]|jgi:hypothetical protein|nr:hypothetical protein [Candidatus Thalassarchaeaceae archaeon]
MNVDEDMLFGFYSAKLDELREIAISNEISKAGNVEQLRARLIEKLVLSDVDLSWESLQEIPNNDLGELLGYFGIKRSGSIKLKRQRLWLHLNHDPKKLNPETISEATRDELHELCKALELQRSGSKQQLFSRVAGVLALHDGGWGKVKKSLKRGKKSPKKFQQMAPSPPPDETPEVIEVSIQEVVTPPENEAAELAAMIQESIDSVDVDALNDVLAEAEEEPPEEVEGIVEPETANVLPLGKSTIDEGTGAALIELDSRMAELHCHIREFLLIGREHDANDVTAFIEDLGAQGFRVTHAAVRERILSELTAMAGRRDQETSASGQVPGSWRERKALRRLEECRAKLLDSLEDILDSEESDIALARVRFEAMAAEEGLDMELPGISGRVHGLFDLQISLRASEDEMDPVTARRHRAMEVLYRGTQDVSADAMRTLQRFEEQIEAFERIVETLVRRSDGQFGPVEHALLIRFLERRGWDVGHPEVRPRAISSAGVLAAAMGYIGSEDIPGLPSALSLDPDKVSDVVDSLRGLLEDMGRPAPTADSVAHGVPASVAEQANEISTVSRVKTKLDKADELLGRLSKGFDAEASE